MLGRGLGPVLLLTAVTAGHDGSRCYRARNPGRSGPREKYGGELAADTVGRPAPPGLSRRVSRSRWTISLPGEFGKERGPPFLEGGELGPELLQLAAAA